MEISRCLFLHFLFFPVLNFNFSVILVRNVNFEFVIWFIRIVYDQSSFVSDSVFPAVLEKM